MSTAAYVPALFGLFGGVAAELLQWFRIFRFTGFPEHAKSWTYWIVTVLMVASGAGLVLMYQFSKIDISPVVAFNLGASAPLILANLVGQVPEFLKTD